MSIIDSLLHLERLSIQVLQSYLGYLEFPGYRDININSSVIKTNWLSSF